jgi:hypothetical protein
MENPVGASLRYNNNTAAANENSDIVLGHIPLRNATYDMNHSVLEWFDLRGQDLFYIIEMASFCGPRSCLTDATGILVSYLPPEILDNHEFTKIQNWIKRNGQALKTPFALKLSRKNTNHGTKNLLVCPINQNKDRLFSITVY